MSYRTVVADPPWRYHNLKAGKTGAERFYSTMSVGEICALRDTLEVEPDAHLWMWGTNAMLEEAFDVVRAWGFRPITVVTWCKPQPGVGSYVRNNTEHCILASRGAPLTPETKAISSWYTWPRGRHSEKPDAFYDLVEQVSPGPYLEMFSRRARFGWDVWGNESLGTVELSTDARS